MMPHPTTDICQECGAAIDTALLGGACPGCLLSDAMGGGEGRSADFDGHELLGEIARGGMGVVYRARQLEPERFVALKTLRSASLDSPEAMMRFRHESEVMVALDHPAILPVYHCGEQDGIPFFTMKLVEGGTLAERIGSYEGKWRAIAALMATLCDGVRHAHERGVLHRDLKPGNVLFDTAGQAYVSDFGIAKLADSQSVVTMTMAMIGTPHYLAPEVAAGSAHPASVPSDVWSLGVILYELLTGELPYPGDSVTTVLRALDAADAVPPRKLRADVPRDLEVITLKALSRDPARRYASGQAFANDLRAWLDDRPIAARAVPAPERAWMWARRNPKLAVTTALLVLAMVGTAAALAWGFVSVKRQNVRVMASEAETRAQLRAALLHQAHSGRVSREAGWRQSGLAALQRAHAIQPGDDARDELVAHLAGYDLVPRVRVFDDVVLPSPSLKYCLRTKNDTAAMAVARLDDLANLFDVPDPYGGRLTSAVFAPDESWVAVGTETGTRVFTMPDGKQQLAHWPGFVLVGAASDRSFLQLARSSQWRVMETKTWTEIAQGEMDKLTASKAELVKKVPSFHSDPNVPLCLLGDGSAVRVINWRTGEEVERMQAVRPPQSYGWRGANLIVGCSDIGQVHDYLRGREVFIGPGFAAANYLSTTPGHVELLASSEMRQTALWHLHSGQRLVSGRGLVAMTMAADGLHFMGRNPRSEIGRIERPSVMRFLPDALLKDSVTAKFRSLAISADGRLLAAHDRTQVVVHELESGRLIARREAQEIIALGFTADDRSLLVLHSGGLEVWALGREGKRLTWTKTKDVPAPPGRTFISGRMLQDGARFLASTPKMKPYHELWRLHRDQLKWERQPAPESPSAGLTDVTPDGIFNIGGQNQYNVVNNIEQKRFVYIEPDDLRNALGAFSPDGKQLVMVDVNHEWKLYGEDAWHHPKPPARKDQTSRAAGAVSGAQIPAWARSGRWFAVSPDGKRVSLVDARSERIHLTLESPVDLMIDAMLISEDERTLVLQRRGGCIEIWSLEKLRGELKTLGVEVTLPEAPARRAAPPELEGEFDAIELPAWEPKWMPQSP